MFAKIRGEGGPLLTHFCKLCDVEDEMSSKPYSHFHGRSEEGIRARLSLPFG
jgi:hypothetical protein